MEKNNNKKSHSLKMSLIGGLSVVLPILIFIYAILWFIEKIAKPVGEFIINHLNLTETRLVIALVVLVTFIVIIIILLLIDAFVTTRLGGSVFNYMEKKTLLKLPGYKMVRETVNYMLNKEANPFSEVALVNIFENNTRVLGFITAKHENDFYTVFIPTSPNPTSGMTYIVRSSQVEKLNVNVEDMMKSIIGCGAFSNELLKTHEINEEVVNEKTLF